jgi:hypothetical protein
MPEQVAAWSAESAFAKFLSLFDQLAKTDASANEAETRLKIINTIFFEVLDWSKSDVEVEKYCREVGFSDYVFTSHETIALILEAKRVGVSFTIPNTKFKTDPVCFALLETECKEAGQAMRQALGYAASLGSRYIAISNGHQWLFALTYVQSQSIEERQVIIFDSLDSIRDNFRNFWACFSKAAVSTNDIYPLLLESRKKPAPPKISTSIPGYPVASSRNKFVNELSYILNVVWDVLSRTEHTQIFLDSCYVAPLANEHLIAFAKDVLKRRLAADKISLQAEVANAKGDEIHAAIIGYENEKPFVILGEVGHGKTTFLNYLRLVEAKKLFTDYIQLEANFLDRPDNSLEVNDYIYREVEQQLLDRHGIDIFDDSIVRGALHLQLQRFTNSSRYKLSEDADSRTKEEKAFIQEQLKDRHAYFKSVIRHLKRGQQKSVAIFFDNLDRRDAAIQEAAFLKASAIARDWECVVFICLRPTTFYASLKRGLLDSLAPKTFTVGSPDLALILKRRFKFAEEIANGKIDSPILQDAIKNRNVAFKLPSVAEIFTCCEFSTRKGVSSIAMLSALSNGNIRVLLELTKRMISSGHLETGKILEKIKKTGTYLVPDFEAVKTLLYGDYDQFDPKFSIFVNLFDIYHSDSKEHFIRILILDYLNRFNDQNGGRSAIPYVDLINYLESSYFDVATIQRHLKVLVESECIDASIGVNSNESHSQTVRIKTKGSYHITNLVTEFQYVDALTIDTPIMCNTARAKITETTNIGERIARTRVFLKYLQECATSLIDVEGNKTCTNILKLCLNDCDTVERRSNESAASKRKW